MQKIRASKEYLFAIRYLFDRVQIEKITGLTYGQQTYITNQLKIIKPLVVIKGKGSYYSFQQVKEFQIIKKMNEQFGMKKNELKKAKDTLQQIDESKDLTDKSILYLYGRLFFINNKDANNKIVSLMEENNNQQTFLGKLVLADIEQEIEEKATKIFNFADYKLKKSYSPNLKIA